MPKGKTPGFIDWRNCRTKEIILEDLLSGLIPAEPDLANSAWRHYYSKLEEVKKEKVIKKQFVKRFTDHCAQVTTKKEKSQKDFKAFLKYRDKNKQVFHKENGKPLFYLHPAYELLKQDIMEGKHEIMTAGVLRSTRTAYQDFDNKEFAQRVYQEVRRRKFIAFVNEKRRLKALAASQRRAVATPEDVHFAGFHLDDNVYIDINADVNMDSDSEVSSVDDYYAEKKYEGAKDERNDDQGRGEDGMEVE